MKIETPTVCHILINHRMFIHSFSQSSGHAFILRRFDTGAVSLTTMFRAAFPNAPEHEEKGELQWVRDNYDLSANNGGSHNPSVTRLAGTWVGPALARTLGNAYSLGTIIDAVVEAAPDPKGSYRRSNKAPVGAANGSASTAAAYSTGPTSAPSAASKSLPTPSPTHAPSPAKRRKEASPTPASVAAPASPPPSKTQLPRRSARTKSPAPKVAAMASLTNRAKTPKAAKVVKREEIVTPGGSDETAVDEEGEDVENDTVGSELRDQDIAEQKKLIADLKAKRDTDVRFRAVNDADESMEEEEAPATLKRGREDEKELQFEFKEPEVGERTIATNRRVSRFQMEPRTKSFAWGVAAFAVGMGAV
jgi:hypothetical protein